MTTIVLDRRSRTMVSESKLTITFPRTKKPDVQARTCKIRKVNGILVGASGDTLYTEQILRWAKTKRTKTIKFPEGAEIEGLLLIDGKIIHIDDAGEPIELDQDFFAIGSGGQAALGALYAGADAITAVRIACKIDPHSEEPIVILTLDE